MSHSEPHVVSEPDYRTSQRLTQEAYDKGCVDTRKKIVEELRTEAERLWTTLSEEARGYGHAYFKDAALFVETGSSKAGRGRP